MSRRKLSRRDFIKVAQVGGLGAATAAVAGVAISESLEDTTRKAATCRLCTMHCGTIATVRGDHLVRVEGDPSSPTRGFLCMNGHALPDVVHATDRLLRPLVRGQGGLVETSWDEALTYTATRLRAIAEQYGARSLFVQTGWPFVRHPLVGLLRRFVHAFGSPNLSTVASLCEASARMGRELTCGSNYLPDLERAKTLVLWGANPAHAAPPFAHLVGAFGRTPEKNLVVIDPVRHELAGAATLHLPIRPGTDGALALALIGVLVRRGDAHSATIAGDPGGFEELAGVASAMSVERAASICGLDAAAIERAASLMMGNKPTSVWSGLGIEHHINGVQTVRAVACLEALLGSLTDATTQPMQQAASADTLLAQLHRLAIAEPVPPQPPDRAIGQDDYPLFEAYNGQAQGMLLPRSVLEDSPYPVRALILVGCNPLVSFPDASVMQKVFEKLELIVAIDPFMSASARASHVVLPASTFAETAIAGDVIAPRGDSRPDWRIVFDLGRALDLERYFPWRGLDEALVVQPTARAGDEQTRQTLVRRVELGSPTLARFGHDAVPRYTEPGEAPSPSFPLILVTGPRTRPYINSQLRTIDAVSRHMREPALRIHPTTAMKLGITHGALAEVTTRVGTLVLKAELTDTMREDTVVLPHGWEGANANLLTDHRLRDPISGFPALRYSVCRVRPAIA